MEPDCGRQSLFERVEHPPRGSAGVAKKQSVWEDALRQRREAAERAEAERREADRTGGFRGVHAENVTTQKVFYSKKSGSLNSRAKEFGQLLHKFRPTNFPTVGKLREQGFIKILRKRILRRESVRIQLLDDN